MLHDMPEVEMTLFHGGTDQESENARDFINQIKKTFMKGAVDDEFKIQFFEFSLKDGGPAAEWFAELPEEDKATWAALSKAFDARWPTRKAVVKTQQDKQEELTETKIKEEDLGSKVKVNGIDQYTHVAWADKIERFAKAIPDTNNLLVRATRDAIAPSLCALTVNMADLRERKEERAATEKLKKDFRDIQASRVPPTPSKILAASLDRVQLGNPIPAPNFTATRQTTAAATTTPAKNGRTDAQKWAIIEKLPAPPAASNATKTAHAILVTQWHANNAGMNSATEDRPYPLTPGTAPIGSGECGGCGMMGHFESNCTSPTCLPMVETCWRRKVNAIKRGAATQPSAVNVVAEANPSAALPYSEQDLDTLLQFLSQHDNQGNEEGSSD
ncbi:hypothetical protein H0H92_014010 [Tricholoma furcatifolium]|nr:hypothetical protein H0H92_014010 [Tricholoma furcatifolium]